MQLLLTSSGHEAIGDLVSGRIAFIPDASRSSFLKGKLLQPERRALQALGHDVVDVSLSSIPSNEIGPMLDSCEAIYVAGGETFDLLSVLRKTGADQEIVRRVCAGMPYIGCSAGSVVAGPDITPISIMDNANIAPDLTDYRGLGLTERIVIPHADGGLIGPSDSVIKKTVAKYGDDYDLTLLEDGEALLIDEEGVRKLGK